MAVKLQFTQLQVQEMMVIVYALVAAILLLVAVTMISSINPSDRRRP